MGVSGAKGFIDHKGHRFSRRTQLKDTNVIIDTTNVFFWFVKAQLLNSTNMDKYGASMIDLGRLFWNLVACLKERNVKPYFVLEGARRSERNGAMVSKIEHMTQSSSSALWRLCNGRLSQMDYLPSLAMNCLKEVLSESNLEPDQVHQAECEVYPALVHLANLHNAPVLTAHTDFIFKNVPAGFVWIQELQLPRSRSQPLSCRIFSHQEMLSTFKLGPEHSGALSCLSVLLRDDFAAAYYPAVNRCLNVPGHLRIGPNVRRPGNKTRRLEHIVENWPRNLTDQNSVRANLRSHQALTGPNMLRDFDAVLDCYCQYKPFEESELAQSFQSRWKDQTSASQLREALTRRESSAEFLADALRRNINRTVIEDTTTFRSTFSLQDRAKQFVMGRLRDANGLDVYDRQYGQMSTRQLGPVPGQADSRPDGPTLMALFHVDQAKLESVASRLRALHESDATTSNELALLLLLAAFARRLVPRVSYNNDRDEPSAASGGGGLTRYSEPEIGRKYFAAILNSYTYLRSRTSEGDQSQTNVPADTRVARGKVEEISRNPPAPAFSSNDSNYLLNKHLIEALNSTLHAYKELNSLYNFPAPNLVINKYYDGVLVYKIMARWSGNLREHLLKLDDDLLNELM